MHILDSMFHTPHWKAQWDDGKKSKTQNEKKKKIPVGKKNGFQNSELERKKDPDKNKQTKMDGESELDTILWFHVAKSLQCIKEKDVCHPKTLE